MPFRHAIDGSSRRGAITQVTIRPVETIRWC